MSLIGGQGIYECVPTCVKQSNMVSEGLEGDGDLRNYAVAARISWEMPLV